VCGKNFKEGDDIIACPECGTPHHRVCYNKTNTCANSRMHGTYFRFSKAMKNADLTMMIPFCIMMKSRKKKAINL